LARFGRIKRLVYFSKEPLESVLRSNDRKFFAC